MKKNFPIFPLLLSFLFASCASFGVSREGSSYFIGKKTSTLSSYFNAQDMKSAGGNGDYDNVIECNNKVMHHIFQRTNDIHYKKGRKSTVMNFKYFQTQDNCYLEGNFSGPHKYYYYSSKNSLVFCHFNDNSSVNEKIKAYNQFLSDYPCCSPDQEEEMFEKYDIGQSFYIYYLNQSNVSYWEYDGDFNSDRDSSLKLWQKADAKDIYTPYECKIICVELIDAVRQETEKHELKYNYRQDFYLDENNCQITKTQFDSAVKDYSLKNFGYSKKETGLHIKAFIKDDKIIDIVDLD